MTSRQYCPRERWAGCNLLVPTVGENKEKRGEEGAKVREDWKGYAHSGETNQVRTWRCTSIFSTFIFRPCHSRSGLSNHRERYPGLNCGDTAIPSLPQGRVRIRVQVKYMESMAPQLSFCPSLDRTRLNNFPLCIPILQSWREDTETTSQGKSDLTISLLLHIDAAKSDMSTRLVEAMDKLAEQQSKTLDQQRRMVGT